MVTAHSSTFIDAFRQWRGRDPAAFPADKPPTGGIGDPTYDVQLARVFKDICNLVAHHDVSTPMVKLATHITAHETIIKLRYDAAKSKDPRGPFTAADREAHVAARPHEEMVQRLREWLRDYYEFYVV